LELELEQDGEGLGGQPDGAATVSSYSGSSDGESQSLASAGGGRGVDQASDGGGSLAGADDIADVMLQLKDLSADADLQTRLLTQLLRQARSTQLEMRAMAARMRALEDLLAAALMAPGQSARGGAATPPPP